MTILSPDLVEALHALRAEIGLDGRMRHLETQMAALEATVRISSRPSMWPQIVSSIGGLAGVLVAFTALLLTRT